MVIALVMMITIPTVYVFYSYSQSSNTELTMGQIQNVGNDIVNNAEKVYYLGVPSRIVLEETMPDGIKNMTIINDWWATPSVNELVFYTGPSDRLSEAVFSSRVDINGTFSPEAFSAGVKRVTLEAVKEDRLYVRISIG